MNYNLTPSDINQTFVIEPIYYSGDSPVISACTVVYTDNIASCTSDSEISLGGGTTVFNSDLIPTNDGTIDLGYNISRFRNVNTVSGNSTVWTSSISINTPLLDLGLDSDGNLRQITADNSIIQNDELNSGIY